jgi:hypothetical protein
MNKKFTPDTAVNFQGMEQRTASESRFYQLSFANKLKLVSFVIILSLSMNLYSQNRNALYDSTTCAILPDEDLIKFPSGFFPTLPTIPSPIYKFQNTTGGIPPNDALTIFSEGTIATNHGLIGGFGLFGNATDNKWNALGVRIPATTLPYQSSTGLRSTWGQGGLNVGMGLPYSVLLTSNLNRRDALISWQDATVNGSINAQNGNGTGNFGIGLVDTSAPQIPDERLHLYDQSSLGLDLYQKWSNITNLNGARIGFESGSTTFQIRNEENANMEFWTNGNQQMTLDNVGFLGIGNALLPDERLHLFEQVGGQRNYLKFTTGSATSGALIGQPLGSNVFEIRQDELDDMQFWSNGTLVAHINDQFGLGTPFLGVGTAGPLFPFGAVNESDPGGGWLPNPTPANPILSANGDITTLNNIFCNNIYVASDRRLKENIKPILDWRKILEVVPYKYNYKGQADGNYNYGFIAQDVNKVLPELTNQWGNAGTVNYIGFIPFLTQGLKEHEEKLADYEKVRENLEQEIVQFKETEKKLLANNDKLLKENLELFSKIESIEKKNQLLENGLAELIKKFDDICELPCVQGNTQQEIKGNSFGQAGTLTQTASLEQNEPNPFTESTVIRYFIPEGTGSSRIEIRNTENKVVGSFPVNVVGNGNISISAGTLAAGTYYYSLIINNQVFDTKKMVLNN